MQSQEDILRARTALRMTTGGGKIGERWAEARGRIVGDTD
jgi:hypothetical protein